MLVDVVSILVPTYSLIRRGDVSANMLCIWCAGSVSSSYLTIIPQARVGYEMVDSQRGA